MSRTVLVADEVAALLGDEQLARLQGPEWARPVQCWECDQWIPAEQDAAVLLLRVPELDQGDAGVSAAVHAHPECRSSQVMSLTLAEVDAYRAAHQSTPEDEAHSVDVVATTFDTGRGSEWPVVLLSYRSDLIVDQPHAERVDLLTTSMLARGWHQITSISEPPGPGPHGYTVRFRHTDIGPSAAGVLEVVDPFGAVETVAQVQPTGLWRPAVVRSGRTVVIQGSQYLNDWQTKGRIGVKRAMRAGLLTGGVVPVDLHGPGNAEAPGSVYR